MDTLILRDDVFLGHEPGPGHPESPGRLQAVHEDLDRSAIAGTRTAAPRAADRRELERVHLPAHVERVAATAGLAHVQLDPDTATSAASYEAALKGSGAVLDAIEATAGKHADGAFALVRPPGHHAESGSAMGFCLFNNVAVAAAHAVEELGCRRVLVVDPDVHHGNGTQNSFYGRKDVMYVSSHRFPFYPGTGAHTEIGTGEGEGYTVNLPLPAGMGDADFLHVYQEVVDPIVRQYEPDLILISAGFDTWQRDPLGGMRMTGEGYAALCGLFHRWSRDHCPGQIVFALEGGYDPAGLITGVRATLEVTTGSRTPPEGIEGEVSDAARQSAGAARSTLAGHWTF